MKSLSRVVWSEGMYLGPHHFQAQSRYFEDSIDFAISSLHNESAGMLSITLDSEALGNGTLNLISARGVFPDGLLFQMPECDALPEPRQIGKLFPPAADKLNAYLSVPERVSGGTNTAITGNGAGNTRYIAGPVNFPDETNGIDEKSVAIGRKNIRIVLESELAPSAPALRIARIVRSAAGGFEFDLSFIPPCLKTSASPALTGLLQRLIEIIEEKCSSLVRDAGSRGSAQAGYSSREVANFWFLHTLNVSLAPLRHFFYSKHGHPEELYLELSRLAGSLCTFTLDAHPRSVPPYTHEMPEECFTLLDRQIRERLELLIPTNCISIPLTKAGDFFYTGSVTDQRCIGPSQWILGIRSAVGEAELLGLTPKLLKFCSQQFVPELVKRALPGLTLTHLPVPPPSVSAKIEMLYFALNKSGPCWAHLTETRKVGVYLPGDFPSPELDLLVILDN